MNRYWFVARLGIALTMMAVSVLTLAYGIGIVPDPEAQALRGRANLAQALGLQAASSVQNHDFTQYEAFLKPVLESNEELLSGGLRDITGELVVDLGGHADRWVDPGEKSNASFIALEIQYNDSPWGRAEFAFEPTAQPVLGGLIPTGPMGRLFAFFGAACFAAFGAYLWYILGRVLSDSDHAIPHRVRQALDTLAEGVLILDRSRRIAHANEAFARFTNHQTGDLIGRKVTELGWGPPKGGSSSDPLPWDKAVRECVSQVGVPIVFKGGQQRELVLSVNAAPILADDGSCRGALATFDDMTELERKNSSLQELLAKLKNSRAEIHRQNQELKLLATRDPLTLCLNRRAFFAELNPLYEQAGRSGAALSCVMIDVDRFKQINDRYGHPAGDKVLYQVAELLRGRSRNTDLVCRYGGEEFAMILPQTDLDGAQIIAERVRIALAETPISGVPVTASFGVSAIQLGPNGPQGLLDQSDKALYAAKRTGRNKVVRFDQVSPEDPIAPRPVAVDVPPAARPETAIPYAAVTALISALAYRDSLTAEHSRRVADLCVATGADLLSESDVYLLEVAALMHDIGKLGVPDSILFKPGPLTDEEWKIMRLHDRMGVEIITAAFASEQLTRIIAAHHAWYGGSPHDASHPTGDAIPLPARILAISDAYDAMVSDRVYRKARRQEDAIAELRRCAGTQFDPELVERVIGVAMKLRPPVESDANPVSKETALMIGTQIERLAGLIDDRDVSGLATMATQLAGTARTCGIAAIVDVAGRLERLAVSNGDWVDIVSVTHDLLELCRATQNIYLREARTTGWDQLASGDLQALAFRNTHETPGGASTGTERDFEFVPPPMFGFGAESGNAPATERLTLPTAPPVERTEPRSVVVTLHKD
ncbi:MAG: diguanylate cyclase [Gemmataceae bacterium]